MSGILYQLGGYAASTVGTMAYYGIYGAGKGLLFLGKGGISIMEYGVGLLPEAAAMTGRFLNRTAHFVVPKVGTVLNYTLSGAGKVVTYIAPRTIPALRMTVGKVYQGGSVVVETCSTKLEEGLSKVDQLAQTLITARTLATVAFAYCAYKTLRGNGPKQKLFHLAGAIVSLRVILS